MDRVCAALVDAREKVPWVNDTNHFVRVPSFGCPRRLFNKSFLFFTFSSFLPSSDFLALVRANVWLVRACPIAPDRVVNFEGLGERTNGI